MVCILELIFNFKMFDQVYATTQGGPARKSNHHHAAVRHGIQILPLRRRLGGGVFVFVTLMMVMLLQWRLLRKPIEY
jgi:ABC-type sugar transport system permease subunit